MELIKKEGTKMKEKEKGTKMREVIDHLHQTHLCPLHKINVLLKIEAAWDIDIFVYVNQINF